MQVQIIEITPAQFPSYQSIPDEFRVSSILQVELIDNGLHGLTLTEKKIHTPYTKIYTEELDASPLVWFNNSEQSRWGVFLCKRGEEMVGGAAVTEDRSMLPFHAFGSKEIAVLWDIRVHPLHRGKGIGTNLFRAATNWARARQCKQLWLETSNVNVPACRFYVKQGCQLGAIHRFGYSGDPKVSHEVMLLWCLDL